MTRVMVVHHAGGVGGGTASFIDVLQSLAGECEVIAACPNQPAMAADMARAAGFPVVAAPPMPEFHAYNSAPSLGSRQFWSGMARVATKTKAWHRFLIETRPDVVLVNSSVLVALGPAIRDAGALGVCIVRETLPVGHWRTRILSAMIDRYFDGVVFISDFDKSAASGLRIPSIVAKDCVRPEALSRMAREAACEELGLSPAEINVLFTGGHSWLKGLDTALEAIDLARLDDVRLVVAGALPPDAGAPPSLRKRVLHSRSSTFDLRVRELLERPYVREHVTLVGTQMDMSPCYSASDLVIFPAAVPHQSRPIVEAAYFRIPVVCSDFPQYAEHSPARVSFPSGRSEELASAIGQVLADPAEATQRGRTNHLHASASHDFATEGAKLRDLVDGLGRFGGRPLLGRRGT